MFVGVVKCKFESICNCVKFSCLVFVIEVEFGDDVFFVFSIKYFGGV